MNIADFLNINAEKYAHKIAIGFKKKDKWEEINWVKFKNLVFKTANALQEAGIQENDKVAIYSDNSAEWITFDLAILSLGAITVPIYATNTKEQAEYIINDSEAKIILVGNQEQYDASYEILQKSEILEQIIVAKKLIWIKKERSIYFEDFIEKKSNSFEIISKNEDQVATLIYTSGTTGIPKGVMLTHGNFIKCFDAHFDFFKFKNFENEHSLAFLPLTHVFERSWTLLSLYGGAKVSFLEDTKLIANTLTEIKPTMMCAVPRFYQKIYSAVNENIDKSSATKKKIFNWAMKIGSEVEEFKRTQKNVPFLLNLKKSIAETLVFKKIKERIGGNLWFMPCGGASISPEVTKFFGAMGLHITVGYGLTETSATLTAFPLTNYTHGTAGICLGDTQIKIGENNEILAKGSGIMKGYYKKIQETAEVFTEDGWFKTGDAGEFDENKNLIITDRIKDLMKTSNGKYIAPQPIENMLSNNSLVEQIMIVAEDKPFVTAVIVPNFEFLKDYLKKNNISFSTNEEIIVLQEVTKIYQQKLDEIQKDLASFEKVKKFILLPKELEIASGEITPTLKIKRKVVLKNYADLINKMYI